MFVSDKNKGFTLLEITITFAVIGILVVFFIFNYQDAQKMYALQRSSHKLAQEIRSVEELAISAQKTSSSTFVSDTFPKGGYGIYFATSSPNSYIIFADCNNNNTYDANSELGATSCESVIPYHEAVETISLEPGVQIKQLLSPYTNTSQSSSTIVFFPPEPTVKISPYICGSENCSSCNSSSTCVGNCQWDIINQFCLSNQSRTCGNDYSCQFCFEFTCDPAKNCQWITDHCIWIERTAIIVLISGNRTQRVSINSLGLIEIK